jgi:toxin ParE1/3/4
LKIKWTDEASRDLDEIEIYISADGRPQAAVKTVLKILKTVKQLIRHPALGRPGRIEGTRELIVSGLPYIIPYRMKNGVIEVLRVFHTAMEQRVCK